MPSDSSPNGRQGELEDFDRTNLDEFSAPVFDISYVESFPFLVFVGEGLGLRGVGGVNGVW